MPILLCKLGLVERYRFKRTTANFGEVDIAYSARLSLFGRTLKNPQVPNYTQSYLAMSRSQDLQGGGGESMGERGLFCQCEL